MRPANSALLIIEDNPNDRDLLTLAFRDMDFPGPIHCVANGREAISYLKAEGCYADRASFPYPSFIITDLSMPGGDGFAVLRHLKSAPERAVVPTLVLSSSSDLRDIGKAYEYGANSYFIKPIAYSELRRMMKIFYEYWTECAIPQVDETGLRIESGERTGASQSTAPAVSTNACAAGPVAAISPETPGAESQPPAA